MPRCAADERLLVVTKYFLAFKLICDMTAWSGMNRQDYIISSSPISKLR